MPVVPASERAVFTDLYRYYEKYQPRKFDVEVFCDAAVEMAELVTKHNDSFLAKRMFGAAYEAFGDRYMEERKNNE